MIVQEHFYKWDKWWSMEYGRGMGTMWNFCSRKAANVVQCKYVIFFKILCVTKLVLLVVRRGKKIGKSLPLSHSMKRG